MQNRLNKLIYNTKLRGYFFQVATIAAVIYSFAVIIRNTTQNLKQQGIASGFGFLDKLAGFDISQTLITYNENSTYLDAFYVAICNTLLVSALGIVLATFLGTWIGIARLSSNYLIAKISSFYIETIRNIPLLLQLFFWYFAVISTLPSPKESLSLGDTVFLNIRGLVIPEPILADNFKYVTLSIVFGVIISIILKKLNKTYKEKTGQERRLWPKLVIFLVIIPLIIFLAVGSPLTLVFPHLQGFNFDGGLNLQPEFVALLFALTLYTAAFIAEIVRSGIVAVSKGQVEAATALGLNKSQTLKLIVLPQALRVIIPPLTSQYLNLTKNSSLAAAIAYPDIVLVFSGTVLMQTGQAVEVIALTMAVYLVISLIISVFMNIYNQKVALIEK